MSRRYTELALLVVFITALCANGVAKTDADFHYLDPAQVDLTLLLPPPPDVNSALQLDDEKKVAAEIATRNSSQVAEAKADAKRNVFFFADAVGPQFAASRYPVTSAFFERVGSDVEKLIDLAKSYWARPRPNGIPTKRGSYPSGHAAFAASTAILLAQLVPCKRDQIFNQARTFAENRIVLGVHYPSDIAAGWTAGTVAVFAMMHDSAFKQDFAAAKTELNGECPPPAHG